LGEVIGQFKRAIELDPNLPAPYQGLSQALIYADDVAQSLSVARRAVELGPSDADGLLFLANAEFESGEVAEALETAKRAVELNPLRPPYYYLFNSMIFWGATSAIRTRWTKRTNVCARRRISLVPTPIAQWHWSDSGAWMKPRIRLDNAWPGRVEL
jgi:tetratricopeptide (TPR) repeat protein